MKTLMSAHCLTPEEVGCLREEAASNIVNMLLMEPAAARPKVAPRQANKKELAWWERLRKLISKMPSTMILFGRDETLRAIDNTEWTEWPKSLSGAEDIDICVYVTE